MKYIKWALILFVIASVVYLVAKEFSGTPKKQSESPSQTQTIEQANGIVVYYFHRNRRCPTCMAIEKYSHETIMPYINNNQLRWETVNIETPDNKHFIYDFKLNSSGPVIVEFKSNNAVRWRPLDKVWRLIRDKESFNKYVNEEVGSFLRKETDE